MIAGDLNLPPALIQKSTRWKSLAQLKNYPKWGPRTQLDYLLVEDPSMWGAITTLPTPSLTISDHLPLLLDCGIE